MCSICTAFGASCPSNHICAHAGDSRSGCAAEGRQGRARQNSSATCECGGPPGGRVRGRVQSLSRGWRCVPPSKVRLPRGLRARCCERAEGRVLRCPERTSEGTSEGTGALPARVLAPYARREEEQARGGCAACSLLPRARCAPRASASCVCPERPSDRAPPLLSSRVVIVARPSSGQGPEGWSARVRCVFAPAASPACRASPPPRQPRRGQ